MAGITAKPLTDYYDAPYVYDLIQRYGEQLEDMAFDSLLTFNAVIGAYALYYNFEDNSENPVLTFKFTVERVWNGWKEKDHIAYELCKAICVSSVSSLMPLQKGLIECIECHRDY